MRIKLGDKVRDTVTGLEGTATARCLYLNGCDHIGIQSQVKDGKIPPIQWVDEPQVVIVQEAKSKRDPGPRNSGGPSPGGNPSSRAHPDE